ncbi:MAG: RagB/SusD family nutrient uptake outer membrane protein [Bacteroidales bacterium]|nr:RagB/SusD family nutrient uptake outer membrane protein [Bacteroidales bacterium]
MAVAAFALSGCNSFLDTVPTDRVSDKMVWSSTEYADLYVNNFYEYLSVYGQFGSAQFSGSLTEGLTNTFKYGSSSSGAAAGDANDYVFYPEKLQPSGSLLDCWSDTYIRIRRINEFLDSQKKYSSFSKEVNIKYEAQARFFRAFLYFQLAKRHTQGSDNGGLILYDDLNMQKNVDRSTAEATWQFIADDLDFAAENLPKKWDPANAGRITKYGAYAFKSRAMLYAERWEDAKASADSVINCNLYQLTDDYADSYKGGNSESIIEFAYNGITGPSHSFDKNYVPYGDYALANSAEYGGKGTPTQEMVEMYETKTGEDVDWTKWHGETKDNPPYEDLEPRFHATILYPGSSWKGFTIMPTENGSHGRYMAYKANAYPNGRTVTGYYLRKLLDESHSTTLLTVGGSHTWVEMRLAEVYLNRAEALYRLGGNDAAARADIDFVRDRVDLPASRIRDTFEAIRHERLIELAYEGHLYWDMRRWELAHTEYEGYRCHGLKVTGPGSDGKYKWEYVDCDLQDRKFLKKTYILPVPVGETINNSTIEQYDEWK